MEMMAVRVVVMVGETVELVEAVTRRNEARRKRCGGGDWEGEGGGGDDDDRGGDGGSGDDGGGGSNGAHKGSFFSQPLVCDPNTTPCTAEEASVV